MIAFIQNYLRFSEYVSSKSGTGRFSISAIKNIEDSTVLASKSWLFESIRYLFPKRFGLPIRDNVLIGFLFGETSKSGEENRFKWKTEEKELLKRMLPSDLFAIDYRISKLSLDDFKNKGLEITAKELIKLKKGVAYYIYYFIFGGYHESTYVSKSTLRGLDVGSYYFTPEYFVIRSTFFLASEANNGEPLSLKKISSDAGISGIQKHLKRGLGFDKDLDKLSHYIKDLLRTMPSSADKSIIRTAKEVFDGYQIVYEARYKELQDSIGYRSVFQGRVHEFINKLFGTEFFSEKQVRSAVDAKEITTINNKGVYETIKVHHGFYFDGYLELSREFKKYLGLDDKWIGIAFEAMGTYWHSRPEQQERDRKKSLICRDKNIILLEIWEDWDENIWINKVFEQIEDKTGTKFTKEQFSRLRNYLGILKGA